MKQCKVMEKRIEREEEKDKKNKIIVWSYTTILTVFLLINLRVDLGPVEQL